MVSMSTIKGEDVRADLRKIFKKDLRDLLNRKQSVKESLRKTEKYSSEWVELKTRLNSLNKRIVRTKKLASLHEKPIEKESIYVKE